MAPATRASARVVSTGFILFSACCFGAISTLVLVATRAGAALFAVLAYRYIIAAAVMGVLSWRELMADRRRGFQLFIAGGVGQALIAGVSLSSLRWIDVATLGFLFYTYPAWVAVIAAVRRTEPLDGRKLVALALSLAGIAFIIMRPGSGAVAVHPIGLTLALAAAVVYAAYIPLIGGIQGQVPATTATAWIGAGAAVAFAAVAAARGELTLAIAPAGWMAIVTLALVCTALAFVLFLRGLAALGPVRTAIVSTVEPFFTALIAAAVLKQPLTVATLAGGGLIAVAVVVLQAGRLRTVRQDASGRL